MYILQFDFKVKLLIRIHLVYRTSEEKFYFIQTKFFSRM